MNSYSKAPYIVNSYYTGGGIYYDTGMYSYITAPYSDTGRSTATSQLPTLTHTDGSTGMSQIPTLTQEGVQLNHSSPL